MNNLYSSRVVFSQRGKSYLFPEVAEYPAVPAPLARACVVCTHFLETGGVRYKYEISLNATGCQMRVYRIQGNLMNSPLTAYCWKISFCQTYCEASCGIYYLLRNTLSLYIWFIIQFVIKHERKRVNLQSFLSIFELYKKNNHGKQPNEPCLIT